MKFSIRDLLLMAQEQHPAPLSQLAFFGAILGVIILAPFAAWVIVSRVQNQLPNSSAPAPNPPKK